jgi:uncharacterized protein YycO
VNEAGVMLRDFSELSNLTSNSYLKAIIAFRPITSEENKQHLVDFALQQVGKEYDFDFDTEDFTAIFCSELIQYGLEEI